MKTMTTQYKQAIESLEKNKISNFMEDVSIDIFHENIAEYLHKLKAASLGRYELDDYDLQVISIALEQNSAR